ncbi:MAG: hypothetical protein Q7R64_03680, partial [bacterium]|nr:hypothetical protein [bacterium]
GQRVKYITGGTTTYYPSKSYKVDSKGKAVKHLFAGGLMGTATIGRELLVSIVPLARPEGRYSTFL